jgi:hypothetical protein
MPIRSWSALVVLSLLSAGPVHAATPDAPSRSELSLAGLKIGDSLAAVRKRLGPPLSTTGAPGDHDYVLVYRGLRIEMVEPGQVLMLESSDPGHCTPSGVCPGQALDAARTRWGEGETYEGDDDGTWHYAVDEEACFLQVRPDPTRQRIHSLSFGCP